MLHIVPIEPLEERYSRQWYDWTRKYLDDRKIEYIGINPESYSKIENGKFLDIVGTNVYKNRQMEIILGLFKDGLVVDGDVFWFHDLWFPGLEMLFYLRDALHINFKIYGCLHAGTYDPYDFLTQCGMSPWGEHLENAWLEGVDGVFVATCYHARLLHEHRKISPEKLHVTGFPFYPMEFLESREIKPKRTAIRSNLNILADDPVVSIVFPHRLDVEKHPEMFDQLEEILRSDLSLKRFSFVFTKTKEFCATKEDYYDVLAASDIAVSFADQETWGIAMQEAVVLGCLPVVPAKLSYMEMYSAGKAITPFFDGTVENCAEVIKDILNRPQEYEKLRFESALRSESNGASALANMLYIMGWRTF